MAKEIVNISERLQDYIVNAQDIHDGVQVVFRFPNNYGARDRKSVV